MHLGVDDRTLARGLRPRLLRACGQRSAGDQRRADESASRQHDLLPDRAALWRRFVVAKTVTRARQSANPIPTAFAAATGVCAFAQLRATVRASNFRAIALPSGYPV